MRVLCFSVERMSQCASGILIGDCRRQPMAMAVKCVSAVVVLRSLLGAEAAPSLQLPRVGTSSQRRTAMSAAPKRERMAEIAEWHFSTMWSA
jgi:hypothetical protein